MGRSMMRSGIAFAMAVVDVRRAPYSRDANGEVLAVTAGERGRVYARVAYRRAGSKRVRHKTVSRRFVMCR